MKKFSLLIFIGMAMLVFASCSHKITPPDPPEPGPGPGPEPTTYDVKIDVYYLTTTGSSSIEINLGSVTSTTDKLALDEAKFTAAFTAAGVSFDSLTPVVVGGESYYYKPSAGGKPQFYLYNSLGHGTPNLNPETPFYAPDSQIFTFGDTNLNFGPYDGSNYCLVVQYTTTPS